MKRPNAWDRWVARRPMLGTLLMGLPTLAAVGVIAAIVVFTQTGDWRAAAGAIGLVALVAGLKVALRLSLLTLVAAILAPIFIVAAVVGRLFFRRSLTRDAWKATRFPYEQS